MTKATPSRQVKHWRKLKANGGRRVSIILPPAEARRLCAEQDRTGESANQVFLRLLRESVDS